MVCKIQEDQNIHMIIDRFICICVFVPKFLFYSDHRGMVSTWKKQIVYLISFIKIDLNFHCLLFGLYIRVNVWGGWLLAGNQDKNQNWVGPIPYLMNFNGCYKTTKSNKINKITKSQNHKINKIKKNFSFC